MRVYLTGASGFVGSNVARVFEAHGAELATPRHSEVDVTDPVAVRGSVEAFRPDAIVHCAILNDFAALYSDRRAGWDAYVGATRNLVDAANDVGARIVLVSTDWVFDGTQGGATELTPPNPDQPLRLPEGGERAGGDRARGARLGGADRGGAGVAERRACCSRASRTPASATSSRRSSERLRAGERFGVWESDDINMVATPTLASDAAELMWRIAERDLDGIFHCCGGESVDRRTLAMRAAQVFELDPTLLDLGVRPPERTRCPPPVPYDTSLDATWTAACARGRAAGRHRDVATGCARSLTPA